MKKKVLIIIACLLAVAGVICGIYWPESEINNTISDVQEIVENEIKEVKNESTSEIVEITGLDEQTVEVEQEVESDAQVEQENIAYNGTSTGNGLSLLGECTGLTYYSQADSRWANYLYTSTNNSTQTMKSSACGPTSAAMVVSSSKGTILPTTMANLFVENGFRTANNGTAWSAYSWVADYFDFNDYKYTSNIDTMLDHLNRGYYVIASCGSGLFTYGGHYIVLTGIENNTIKIYDPYLYSGKFNTASRKGKVMVDGNTVYCSVDKFKNYSSYKGFWCFSNDSNVTTNNNSQIITVTSDSNIENVNYNVKITGSSLRVREGASTKYKQVSSYIKGTIVNITGKYNNWGKTEKGWICLDYTTQASIGGYTTGTYKVNCNKLNVRTGPGTNYRKKSIKELTKSARNQGGYVKNVRCTVYQIKGEWGRTPSGWICLRYCIKL